MPRPKKAGAPQPKKRSRKGCWPCKARKVKCDEAHPSCLNCQRIGGACDYSIRLNWEGRGKKKAEGVSQVIFPSGTSNFCLGVLSTGDTQLPRDETCNLAKEPESRLSIQETKGLKVGPTEPTIIIPVYIGYSPVDLPQRSPDFTQDQSQSSPDTTVIDPTLMGFPNTVALDYQEEPYDLILGRPDQFYTQSYERYHSATDNVPQVLCRPEIATVCDASTHRNEFPAPLDVKRIHSSLRIEARSINDDGYFNRPSKRGRYNYPDQDGGGPALLDMPPLHLQSNPSYFTMNTTPTTPTFPMSIPLTPASPPTDTEDEYKTRPAKIPPHTTLESPNPRRLSVGSLLSGLPGILYQHSLAYGSVPTSDIQTHIPPSRSVTTEEMATWGIDRGFPDLDIGKNDDASSISGGSPLIGRDNLDLARNEQGVFAPIEFGFGIQAKNTEFQNGNYYIRPVTIKIPKSFEPLPASLQENNMNLLYFHHFISHTARILVSHHCSANPFQNILPKMALQDPNLMNLLLAYSASHRARLLHQPEPATRIALWVKDIFPSLRRALNDPTEVVSNSNLATAIMLTSLEIISPKAFGVDVPWQQHLDTARQILVWRGKCAQSDRSAISNFLLRWFAYIDVLGSLMGGQARSSSSTIKPLLPNNYTDNKWTGNYDFNEDSDYQIDCLLGFTSRCVSILAKIAKLATICDRNRFEVNGDIQPKWAPSEEIRTQAEKLRIDLEAARTNNQVRPCPHLHSAGETAYKWDTQEMAATNEAFHWAGLIHLDRRVLGKASTHHDVQNAVREISGTLYKVRKGSTAEVCLLFPIFTAGCDAKDERQKALIMDRLKGIEEFGMSHVHMTRTLMQKVWDTGKPWETLVSGEFVG